MREIAAALVMLSSLACLAQQASSAGKASGTKKPDPKHAAALADRGQFVFQHYCIRCHTPPQGFSPRISETVAMHMRVRANLSEQDFTALVHFLNP